MRMFSMNDSLYLQHSTVAQVQGMPAFLALSGLTGAVPVLPSEKDKSCDRPPVADMTESLDKNLPVGAALEPDDK